MDLFVYRTYDEIGYVERVNGNSAALLESWRRRSDVEDTAYLLGKPQLWIEFRFLRKASNYWTNCVRSERRAAEATGYAVPYQCVKQNDVKRNTKGHAYERLNNKMSKIDPPRGCDAEMPSIYS